MDQLVQFIDKRRTRCYTAPQSTLYKAQITEVSPEAIARFAGQAISVERGGTPVKRKLNYRFVVWTAFIAVTVFSLTSGVGAVQGDKKIRMYDDCEPTSFNDVIGEGGCVGNGHTTFDEFIQELSETQDAHAWRNQPSAIKVNIGRPTVIENRGGEVHTFTPVANFGGGFITDLNGISGNPVPAPECLNLGALIFVPAGGTQVGPTAGSPQLSIGSHKFQCCIHPWMRTTIEVLANTAQVNKPEASKPETPMSAHGMHH